MGKGGKSGIAGSAMDAASKMFWQSNPARKAMFKQLASALQTGGGAGFKSGVVHQAVARSLEANQAALRGASTNLPTTMDPGIRGRILNRISRSGMANTAAIGPSFANALIGQAPAALGAGATESAKGFSIGAAGEGAAREAAATRAAGWGNAATSVAAPAGEALARSSWFKKYFGG